MSERSSKQPDVFSVDRITELIELMKEHDLSEVDLRQEDMRIKLRRGAEGVFASPAPPIVTPQPPAADPNPAAEARAALVEITSPMVGTFYRASNPESPPYCNVGDHVVPDTTVCMIEAMKVFNEIPAELSGTVAEVCVENGEPVEFGQVLFRVKPD